MRKRKIKPMSINRINLMLEDVNSDYHLEKINGEIIMVKNKKGDD